MPSPLLLLTALLTTLLVLATGLYFSPYKDDMAKFMAERFFKAKAEAEKTALRAAGSEKVEGFLKEQLKKNPVVSNEELDDVAEGLGGEAREGVAGGKLGEGIAKAFD